MAHRILHQISSNVSKSPLRKGAITLRSPSPQNDGRVSRKVNFSSAKAVSARPNTCTNFSSSTPSILQSSYNPNVNGIRKKSKHVDQEDQKEVDEEPEVESVHKEVSKVPPTVDEGYLVRFKKYLEDSDYPKQSAREFPLNKRIQSVSRDPGLKLNEQVVNLMRTRSEYRRLNNRRLHFEDVEEQADFKYQKALRKMHKIGQKINTNQYKIDINPSPKLVQSRSNVKSSKLEHHAYHNRSLQPSNLYPFGETTSATDTEKYKSIKIVMKPNIETSEVTLEQEIDRPSENIPRPNERKANFEQYNTLEQQKGSDEFTDEMKMLEPNYKPQKRYRSSKRNLAFEAKLLSEDCDKIKSKTDLKECQSIINHLKDLNPDYVSPTVHKKEINEIALVQSTINLINDYRNAVLSSRIDVLNDRLYHTIKARHERNRFQRPTPVRRTKKNTPIKVSVGSKFDLQQCNFLSLKDQPRHVKSTPNEKVLVPWPSFSDRRKFNMPTTAAYTDIHKNISVLHLPMEMKLTKPKLEWSNITSRPAEVFLPMTRSYSTKAKTQLNISEGMPSLNANNVVQTNLVNIPKFEFHSIDYSKPKDKIARNIIEEPNSTLNAKTNTIVTLQEEKSNTQIRQKNSATELHSVKVSNIKLTQNISSLTDKLIFEADNKTGTKMSKLTLPNLLAVNQDHVKKYENQNYVHQVGNNTTITKVKLPVYKSFIGNIENDSQVCKKQLNKKKSASVSDKSSLKTTQLQQIESTRKDLKVDKFKVSSNKLSIDMSQMSAKQNCENAESGIQNPARSTKKNYNGFDHSSLRFATQTTTDPKDILKKQSTSNQRSINIPEIGNIKIPKKASATTNLNSCSGIRLKKTDATDRSYIKTTDKDVKLNSCVLQSVQPKGRNIIPLKRVEKTIGSLFSNEEKDASNKSKEIPQLTFKAEKILNNPSAKRFVNENITHKAERMNIANDINGQKHSQVMNSFNSNKFDNPILSTCANNFTKRKFSMIAIASNINDIAVCKNTFGAFNRTYCCENNAEHAHYTKRVRMKRLKKRPGFAEDFPLTSDWKLLKHCKTLCEQMMNPKMDKLVNYEKAKKLPRIKRSNCPCVENDVVTKSVKLTKGPPIRPEYVEEDSRMCKIEIICPENNENRADTIAGYVLKKKKLPVLLPTAKCIPLVNTGLVEVSKRVRMKRLQKRPGFAEDFPLTSDWKLLKHCKTLCEQMLNPKMDKMLNYEGKPKKLPRIKRSNCPCVETDVVTKSVKLTRGPKIRPEYVEEDSRICTIDIICPENNENRADTIAGYVLKKKKLPVLLPKPKCFSTLANKPALLEVQTSNPNKKSMHTSIPLPKQQAKNNKTLNMPTKLAQKSVTNSSIKLNKRRRSPYLSYSEHKLSRSNSEIEIFELNGTPQCLQPNCNLIGATVALEPSSASPIYHDVRHGENFTKIPKPIIKELSKYKTATASALHQNLVSKKESGKIASTNITSQSTTNKVAPNIVSIPLPNKEPIVDVSPKEISTVNLTESTEPISEVENIPQEPVLEELSKESFTEGLKNSTGLFLEARNIQHDCMDGEKERMVQNSQSSAIDLNSTKSETNLLFHMASELEILRKYEQKSSVYDKYSIDSPHETLHTNIKTNQTFSLWDRLTNYLKTKLDNFAEVQEEKLKPDLLLCSGGEKNLRKSAYINENTPLLTTVASKDGLTSNQNSLDVALETQESENPYQMFCKEYDALIESLKKDRERKLQSEENCDSETRLKSSILRSKQIFKKNNLSAFAMQTRSYSSRCPKTPYDIIQYFKKIEEEKNSTVDENELKSNILTAIRVGIEATERARFANANRISYSDLYNYLDPISKAELQSINAYTEEITDSYLWPSESRKTEILDECNKEIVDNLQQFCKNPSDFQNCSVLEYEESERKKTEDLQRVLDEILKRHACS